MGTHGLETRATRNTGETPRPAGAFFQQITAAAGTAPPPASDADPPDPRDLLAGYQRQGLFVEDAARVLDSGLASGQRSPFIKFKLNKDGKPASSGSDAITGDQLDALLVQAESWMASHGKGILAGSVSVTPYRLSNRSPCAWCDYRSVCRLDFAYNQPRYLAPCGRKRALESLAE